eukprot:XP_014780638.1 PREDICTED: chitinase-3-like protein 1 [Octopus bimaculoides]
MERASITSLSPLLLLLLSTTVSIVAGELRRVCYYTNWSQYRKGAGKFLPSDIDPQLCTHICFAFAKVTNYKLQPAEWNDKSTPWSKGLYEQVNDLKTRNPQLKTLLSYLRAGNAPCHTTKRVKDFLSDEGVDLMDWPPQSSNLNPIENECQQAFERESNRTGKPRLLLTAAVPAGKIQIDAGYDIKSLHLYVDFFNVMTYDYHGAWENKTGHISPFRASSNDSSKSANFNVEWTMRYWREQGAPVSKLNLGLPFYGRSFTLADPNKNGTNAPVTGKGTAGEFTGEAGFLAYYEICQMIQRGATIKRLSDEKVPYLVLGNQWVGYDDPESLYMKVEWAKQSNFSGIFVWAMDLDDFIGTCPGNESYILMKTVIRAAKGEPQIIPSTTETSTTKTSTIKPSTIKSSTIKTPSKKLTTATETTTTETTTAETTTGTTNDDTVGFCVGKPDKLYAVPQQCDFFYQCNAGNTYLMKCPPGTVFNPQISICDHAFNVPGC